jgi:DNA-directed RNA polymerase specialized sigma24 family protein
LTDEQLGACIWYREQFDESGLDGRIKTVDYAREVFASPQSRLPFTTRQSEAQDALRAARGSIEKRYRKFFDMVVLADFGAKEAAETCGFSGKRATRKLSDCAQAVQDCRLKLAH